jgi:hypothetical protein
VLDAPLNALLVSWDTMSSKLGRGLHSAQEHKKIIIRMPRNKESSILSTALYCVNTCQKHLRGHRRLLYSSAFVQCHDEEVKSNVGHDAEKIKPHSQHDPMRLNCKLTAACLNAGRENMKAWALYATKEARRTLNTCIFVISSTVISLAD